MSTIYRCWIEETEECMDFSTFEEADEYMESHGYFYVDSFRDGFGFGEVAYYFSRKKAVQLGYDDLDEDIPIIEVFEQRGMKPRVEEIEQD